MGMDISDVPTIITAVILGNGLSLLWFLAAVRCHRMQRNGAKDDELPWWVYLGLMAAPLAIAGAFLLL